MKISGLRRLAVVGALAAGLLLALSMMPGCSLGCPTPEQEAYFKKAEEWAERSGRAFGELRTILLEGGDRPELVLDEGYRRRLKRILDESTSNHQAMIDVDVSPGAEEVHSAVVRAVRTFIEANELLWQGVMDVDVETMQRGGGEAYRRHSPAGGSNRDGETLLRMTGRQPSSSLLPNIF